MVETWIFRPGKNEEDKTEEPPSLPPPEEPLDIQIFGYDSMDINKYPISHSGMYPKEMSKKIKCTLQSRTNMHRYGSSISATKQ